MSDDSNPLPLPHLAPRWKTHAIVLACLASIVATSGLVSCRRRSSGPPPGHRTECIVTDSETRAVFALLTPALRGSDCSFVGLTTDRDRMSITLGDGHDAIPSITLAHAGCRVDAISPGARYGVVVPPSAATRCPLAVGRIRGALQLGDAR